jgi:hypothetical protein
MSTSGSEKRASVRDILAVDDLKANIGQGMSEKDIANLLAPLIDLPGGLFLVSMKAGYALAKELNIKNNQRVEKIFPYSYPYVVRAVVLALGSLKREIITLIDTPKGSAIEAQLPNDIWSLGGSILFEIVDENSSQVRVIGASEIQQKFDWGKGKRSLNEVFNKVEQYLVLLTR